MEDDVILRDVVADLPLVWQAAAKRGAELEIQGICHDSRRVESGDLFVTWKGEKWEGDAFIEEAERRGAVAVVADSFSGESELPCLLAEDPRSLLGAVASRVYEHPDRELCLVGVTGTNGKSTTVALVAEMLTESGKPAACLGTLGYRFGSLELGGERTTPEASDLFRILRRVRDQGAEAAVMEVSSHALVQGRVSCAGFDIGVFLNLSRDHLDFHKDMERYYEAKSRLFELLNSGGRAVVGVDDSWGVRLAEAVPGALTFGENGAVRFASRDLTRNGVSGVIQTPRGRFRFRSPLLGGYNASNILAAAAVAEALALPHRSVAKALESVRPLPGRMEVVDGGQPFAVIVDFAHTDGALRAALGSMRSLGEDRLVVVFGCGGERDRGKRELMGRAAAELADFAIATSDNPRGEEPEAILEAVERGMSQVADARYEVIPDRARAIERAIAIARPGWSVLIAGKGHEETQIVGTRRIPFVDREVAMRALGEGFGSASIE